MINETLKAKRSGLVWSGLSTTWFSSLVWAGWECCGIGTWTKRTISAKWYSLCGSPRLNLCGWSLIMRSGVWFRYPKSAYVSLRSMYCICIAVITRDKASPMRDTSISTHPLISLTIVNCIPPHFLKSRDTSKPSNPPTALSSHYPPGLHEVKSIHPYVKSLRPKFRRSEDPFCSFFLLIIPDDSCQRQ